MPGAVPALGSASVSDHSLAAAAADNKLPGNWESIFELQLKILTKAGKLVKPAGKNAYKLGEALKAPKKKAVSIEQLDTPLNLSSDLSTSCLSACPVTLNSHTCTNQCTIHRAQAPEKATATNAKKPAAKNAIKKASAKPKAKNKAETKAGSVAAAPAAAPAAAKA